MESAILWLVVSTIVVCGLILWDAYHNDIDDEPDQVERMLDMGQQPGGYEP